MLELHKGTVPDYDTIQAFLNRISQWTKAIQINLATDQKIDRDLMQIFSIEPNETGGHLKVDVTQSFDLLRLGHFDRISRHQAVTEVARFVAPFFGLDCVDLEYTMQLVEMLLTLFGGVEVAILAIH